MTSFRRLSILAVAALLLPTLLTAQERGGRGRTRVMAEVTLQVVEASSDETVSNEAANLVPQELKDLMRFTRYRLLDSAFVRGTEREPMRLALAGTLTGEIQFEVRDATGNATPEEALLEVEVEINGPESSGRGRPALLETTTTVSSGETVVLGASRMRDGNNALIVLLTANLLP